MWLRLTTSSPGLARGTDARRAAPRHRVLSTVGDLRDLLLDVGPSARFLSNSSTVALQQKLRQSSAASPSEVDHPSCAG